MIWGLLFFLFSINQCFATVDPKEIIDLTNKYRTEHGIRELKYNHELTMAAEMKAEDMIISNYWAHISPDGITPWDRIIKLGYKYEIAGENLARGYDNSLDVLNAWLASPTHLKNIESPDMCDIGVASIDSIVVQIMACPKKKIFWNFW